MAHDFPYPFYQDYPTEKKGLVQNLQAGLQIYGRITYQDAFGTYCEPFSVIYRPKPVDKFLLGQKPGTDFCATAGPHLVLFNFYMHHPKPHESAEVIVQPPPPNLP